MKKYFTYNNRQNKSKIRSSNEFYVSQKGLKKYYKKMIKYVTNDNIYFYEI